MVLPLLLPEWVLCLSDFCLVEWSQQHSSLGPQLTSHMLGDPRGQDQVCLQHTSMSGLCMVGLQECLVARGWGHRGFHTEGLETHCRQLAWFKRGSRPMGRPSGLVCFGCSCLNRWRSSMLPPVLVSILTWTEVVPLLLVLAGSFMTAYASFHHWALMLSMIISFGCMSPTVLRSIAAMNRSLCGGSFLYFGFGSLCFSPLFVTLEMGLMMGCFQTSGAGAVAFCLPVTLFPTTFAC